MVPSLTDLLVVAFPLAPLASRTPLGEPTRTSTLIVPEELHESVVIPSPEPSQT